MTRPFARSVQARKKKVCRRTGSQTVDSDTHACRGRQNLPETRRGISFSRAFEKAYNDEAPPSPTLRAQCRLRPISARGRSSMASQDGMAPQQRAPQQQGASKYGAALTAEPWR